MDLSSLKKFYVTVDEGNISNAAKKLHMSQSALSKSLNIFEERLNCQLFTRTNKGIELTPKGEEVFQFAKKIVQENEIFMKKFYDDEETVEGTISIAAFPYLGAEWLIPRTRKFSDEYPNVRLRIHLEPDTINPYNYDVTLGVHLPNQPQLIQKELFPDYNRFFASEEYLQKHGVPEKPEDLDKHQLITYKDQESYSAYRSINLAMNAGIGAYTPPRVPFMEINSLKGMINAVIAGQGIAELPLFAAVHYPELKPVLPRLRGKNIPICFIYHKNRKNSLKIQSLYEYLWNVSEPERATTKIK